MIYTFQITPLGKPRMTQRDKWFKRDATDSFWQYKDDLLKLSLFNKFQPTGNMRLYFFLPMPASWSKKKRLEMNGNPHLQKPDKDNIEKGFLDCFFANDSVVWHTDSYKYWCDDPTGWIQVENL